MNPSAGEPEDESQNILDSISASELDSTISAAVGRLPEQRRLVFEKRRFAGKTVVQIAEEMKLSPKTVERHLTLAMKDLRHVIS